MLVTGSRRGTHFTRWCALRSNSHGEPVNKARTCAPTLRLRFSPPQRSPRPTALAAKQEELVHKRWNTRQPAKACVRCAWRLASRLGLCGGAHTVAVDAVRPLRCDARHRVAPWNSLRALVRATLKQPRRASSQSAHLRADPEPALLAATEIAPPHSPSREARGVGAQTLEYPPTCEGLCALRLARLDGAE